MQLYNTLAELLEDYEEIAYRPAKKGEMIITHPNMFTGSNENILSVSICSSDMKLVYSRIVRKKWKDLSVKSC